VKKIFAVFALAASVVLVNCAKSDENSVVQIRERMFATQILHVYQNAPDFIGKTISYEGAFMRQGEELSPDVVLPANFVIRYLSDECCSGGIIGFEVKMPQGGATLFPAHNSWVEAVGVLSVGADSALYLQLTSLAVLDKRGEEIVRL